MTFFFIAPSNGIKEAVAILDAPSHCGYSVKRGQDDTINILLPYSSCHMTQKVCDVIRCSASCTATLVSWMFVSVNQDGLYRIILKYQTPKGLTVESLLSCQALFSQGTIWIFLISGFKHCCFLKTFLHFFLFCRV